MENYHLLSNSAYQNLVAQLIKLTEALIPHSENIGDGYATIGYGYTFNRSNNVAIWTASGIYLNPAQLNLLAQIDAAPANQKTALGLTFNLTLNAQEATNLLMATLSQYEGPANSLGMPSSLEKAAFVSLTYNRGVTAVNAHMQEFFSAVRAGNRAEAWFLLRYASLGTI